MSQPSLPEMIDAIRAYMQTCTQGHVIVGKYEDHRETFYYLTTDEDDCNIVAGGGCLSEADARLICALLNAAVPLLDAAEGYADWGETGQAVAVETLIETIYNALVAAGAIKEATCQS